MNKTLPQEVADRSEEKQMALPESQWRFCGASPELKCSFKKGKFKAAKDGNGRVRDEVTYILA